MRNGLGRSVVAVAMLTVFVGANGTLGAARIKALKVGVGNLSGVVQSSTGQFLPNLELRLMQGDKVLAQTRTDKNGKYQLGNITAGVYELRVASERALKFEAAKNIKVSMLSIVIPQRKDYSAAALTETQTQWVWVGVGTAGAAAIAIPVIANNSGGSSSSSTLSP